MRAHKRRARRQFHRLRPPFDASTAAGFPAPRTPAVTIFQAWPELITVAGERYIEIGPQTDFGVELVEGTTGRVIQTTFAGAPGTVHSFVTAETLAAGRVYAVRIRYGNATGLSAWSRQFRSKVTRDLELTPLNVPDEPELGGELPLVPSFPPEVSEERELGMDAELETGHVKRRARATVSRRVAPFRWNRLTEAQRDSLVTFLEARLDNRETFTTPAADVERTGYEWLVRRGSIAIEQSPNSPDHYDVAIEADAIIRDRVFTVGVSRISDGTDPLTDPIKASP